jgi:hypothetical protein
MPSTTKNRHPVFRVGGLFFDSRLYPDKVQRHLPDGIDDKDGGDKGEQDGERPAVLARFFDFAGEGDIFHFVVFHIIYIYWDY